jgi:hypothetical protein
LNMEVRKCTSNIHFVQLSRKLYRGIKFVFNITLQLLSETFFLETFSEVRAETHFTTHVKLSLNLFDLTDN